MFFAMITVMVIGGVYLVGNFRLILLKAKEQSTLMNRQSAIIDNLQFTAVQIQNLLTSGLLSKDVDFKNVQKEHYLQSMERNKQRLDTLRLMVNSSEQQQLFDKMLSVRDSNAKVRERLIDLWMDELEEAIVIFDTEQRQLNEQWLNSVAAFKNRMMADSEMVMVEFQSKADRLVTMVIVTYLITTWLLILLTLQVYRNGKKTTQLLSDNLAYTHALDTAMLVNRVDKDGLIISANNNLCELTGYSEAELVGKSSRIFNSGHHDKTFFKDLWDTILSGSVWQGVIRNKGKNDDFFWMDTVIVPLQDEAHGSIVEFLVFRTNVTAAFELQEKLANSNALSAAILNSVEPQVAVMDTDGTLIKTNRTWDQLALQEVTCLHHGIVGSDYFKDCKISADRGNGPCVQLLEIIDKLMAGGSVQRTFTFNTENLEVPKWFSASVSYLAGGGGQILITITDITVQKKAKLDILTAKEKLQKTVALRTVELATAKEVLETRNLEMMDSMRYTTRIANAILPSLSGLKSHFPSSFILTQPLDVLGGDFLWWQTQGHLTIIAAIDCTGHGVPGSMMSIIGTQSFSSIVNRVDWRNPGMVLTVLNHRLIETLAVGKHKETVQDGMDIALCVIDRQEGKLHVAGAYRPIYYSDKEGDLQEIRGNGFSIGGATSDYSKSFESHDINITDGMMVYLASDGYQSQFGGPKDRKFGKRHFRELLKTLVHLSLEEQEQILRDTLSDWKGTAQQTDDVLVVGLRM